MLGVPGLIFEILSPQIMEQAKRYPKLTKLLIGSVTIMTLVQGLQPTIGKIIPCVKLNSNDELCRHLLRYLKDKNRAVRPVEVRARSADFYRRTGDTVPGYAPDGTTDVDIQYEANGTQYYFANWTLCCLETPMAGVQEAGLAVEIVLKSFSLTHEPFKKLLQQAWETYRGGDQIRKMIIIYQMGHGRWMEYGQRSIRPIDTVDLDKDEKEKLIADIKEYLSEAAHAEYISRGIPYRRGYFFYGPSGTGKTTMSMAIAGQFQCGLYTLSLSHPSLDDDILTELVRPLGGRDILLLEDIDSVGLIREHMNESDETPTGQKPKRQKPPPNRVTLSSLLNALDGATSPEGYILVTSTNIPGALDDALVCAGRVNRKICSNNASQEMAESIFKRMIREQQGVDLDSKAKEFAQHIPERVISPAEIQDYLVSFMRRAAAAIEGVEEWGQDYSA